MCLCVCRFGLITADIAYGDQRDLLIDPRWNDDTVRAIVDGCWRMGKDQCVMVIQVGGVEQAVQWMHILKSQGFNLEAEPRIVIHPRTECNTAHFWIVGMKGLTSVTDVPGGKPFGIFDPPHTNSGGLSGCPVVKPHDRWFGEDGKAVRPSEMHFGEPVEILSRSSPCSLCLYLFGFIFVLSFCYLLFFLWL